MRLLPIKSQSQSPENCVLLLLKGTLVIIDKILP